MNQPIVIAGGGPVGLMLACELGLWDVETIVLERLDRPSERSRGMAINAGVVELLRQRGLMESLKDDGFEFPQAHFAHLWLHPTRLREPHPYTFMVPHSQVERRLEERAGKLGVDVRRGVEVTGVTQDETGVSVQVRTSTGEDTIRAAYLVGCDGMTSTVRSLAGIGFPGIDLPFGGLNCELRVEQGDPLWARLGVNQAGGGFVTVGPNGPDVIRVTTGEFDLEPADPEAPVTLDEVRTTIERITGTTLTAAELTRGEPLWFTRWDAPTRQADRYRDGRILLAGDAAHVFFPLGGQALSTGVEDAVNLGWKLAAEVRGWAPGGLLDTYHGERHPVGARACHTTRAQAALLYPMDRMTPLREIITELIAFDDVNEYLVRMAGGLDVRYPLPADEPHPLLGCRLPELDVAVAGADTSVAGLLHSGRGLLLDLGSTEDLAEQAAGWADRVTVVTAAPSTEIDATALLLRPDGRVAWTSGPGLDTALRTWFGARASRV